MEIQFDNKKDFFYYICNLDSKNHPLPSTSEVFDALQLLTSNFNPHSCDGLLIDLMRFYDEIKTIRILIEGFRQSDTKLPSINKRAITELTISHKGVLSAKIDLTLLSVEEWGLAVPVLCGLAIQEKYRMVSFDRLSDVEKKLRSVIESHKISAESQKLSLSLLMGEFPDLHVSRVQVALKILEREGYLIEKNNRYQPGLKNHTPTILAYFLRKLYNENESVPWKKWENFLGVKRLASLYQQVKGIDRKWMKEIDLLVSEARKSK